MQSFLKYFWEKVSIVIPACFLTFSMSQVVVIHGIIYIVILDTILGIWVSLKYKIFSSHHLSRIFTKIGTYGIAMGSVWILSAVEPIIFGWVFRYTGLFIILTELFSNFEKLALLGLSIPAKLLAKLNKQFSEFLDLKNGEKQELAEDILKNRNGDKR